MAEVSNMMHNDYSAGASVSVARLDDSVLEKIEKGQICVNFYTLVLVQKGLMSYRLKGNLIELGENDLVLVPPNYPVSYDSYTEDIQAINLMIEEDYYNKVLAFDENLMGMEYSYAYDLLPVFHLSEGKAELFSVMSRQIHNTYSVPHLYRQEMIDHLVHGAAALQRVALWQQYAAFTRPAQQTEYFQDFSSSGFAQFQERTPDQVLCRPPEHHHHLSFAHGERNVGTDREQLSQHLFI